MRWQHLMPDLTPLREWLGTIRFRRLPNKGFSDYFCTEFRHTVSWNLWSWLMQALRLMNATLSLTITDDATVRKIYGEENSPKLIFRGWTFQTFVATVDDTKSWTHTRRFLEFGALLKVFQVSRKSREPCLLSKLGLICTEQVELRYHFCLHWKSIKFFIHSAFASH